MEHVCKRGHKTKVRCGTQQPRCRTCEREEEDHKRRIKRDLDLEAQRQKNQASYALKLQELDDKIDHERRKMKYNAEAQEQANTLAERQDQLRGLAEANKRKEETKTKTTSKKESDASSKSAWKDTNSQPSCAQAEWEDMKKIEDAQNTALDQLMGMIGLESVKGEFLSVKSRVDLSLRQDASLEEQRFSCSLLGNPGTGKTTVARIWAKFLTTVGAISGSVFKETTGSKLANHGVSACENLLEEILNDGGGVLFIDEAYQLSSGNSPGGKAVLDYLLAEVENLRGKVVFVLAGYSKQMESFFAHNPGFPSRFPIEMKFEDYTDEELLRILQRQLHMKYNGRMKIDGGQGGKFLRIAARKVGYSRGKEGFGNARAVENCLQVMLSRQAKRVRNERLKRRSGNPPDDLFLTQEDIIGPEPSNALINSKAYKSLNDLIGLEKVKENLKVLMDTVKTNYDRELSEKPLVQFSLNRVFVGSPGTGKTTVAKLFGQVLADLGLLSNGEVVVKNPADFVGSALGQSEANTKGILAATVGKVLVIDEAYGLNDGSGKSGSTGDPFKTAVVDTIVAEVQSVPGEDRCVLLLGYEEQMEQMFQSVNPGLSRRFPLDSAFVFEDFNDDDLAKILKLKLKNSGFKTTDEAEKVALEVLARARNRPNFGNAGAIDILLGKAKESHQKRLSTRKTKRQTTLEAVDFDADYDRATKGTDTDIQRLFEGDVGRERLIALLEGYQARVKMMRDLDMSPDIPFNFLFRGPPGTGKTTTARKMGKVYYDMGFLSGTDVIECSATDLMGQYVGQTGPKVQNMLDKALGHVLFVDEAYRFASGGYGKEAVDELVDCITKTKYQGKMIIILAGYIDEINSLLSINPGMSSRFPESVDFDSLGPADCMRLMVAQLQEKQSGLKRKGKILDISCLQYPKQAFSSRLTTKLMELSKQDGWANARDVKNLAQGIFRMIDLTPQTPVIHEADIDREIDRLLHERGGRMASKKTPAKPKFTLQQMLEPGRPKAPVIQTRKSTTTDTIQGTTNDLDDIELPLEDSSDDEGNGLHLATRDPGVSDAVWEQLQHDKEKEEEKEREYRRLLKAQRDAGEADREALVRQILEEEERRKQLEEKKAKLAQAGLCPAGFAWIQQQGGFRCAGGSHWVSDSDLDKY